MGLYSRLVLPKVVHFTCSLKPNMRQREKVVPLAHGAVLEVGFGSGLNLPYYNPLNVSHVWALDPSPELWAMAEPAVCTVSFGVEFLEASAEAIPLADRSADTVLITYTLCTIPDVARTLGELVRILKPDGELIFCEHGLAPDEATRRWQNRLNPIWKAVGGGCNLNRPIPELLLAGGFRLLELDTMYIPGWKPASYNYWGRAIVP